MILRKKILMKILAICSLETLWHPACWHMGNNLLQQSLARADTYQVLIVSVGFGPGLYHFEFFNSYWTDVLMCSLIVNFYLPVRKLPQKSVKQLSGDLPINNRLKTWTQAIWTGSLFAHVTSEWRNLDLCFYIQWDPEILLFQVLPPHGSGVKGTC